MEEFARRACVKLGYISATPDEELSNAEMDQYIQTVKQELEDCLSQLYAIYPQKKPAPGSLPQKLKVSKKPASPKPVILKELPSTTSVILKKLSSPKTKVPKKSSTGGSRARKARA